MDLWITRDTVRALAKNLRLRTGREFKHTEIIEDIAAAFGLRGDAMMHALKTLDREIQHDGASRGSAVTVPQKQADGSSLDGDVVAAPALPPRVLADVGGDDCAIIAQEAGMASWKTKKPGIVYGRTLSSSPEGDIAIEIVVYSEWNRSGSRDPDSKLWSLRRIARLADGKELFLTGKGLLTLRTAVREDWHRTFEIPYGAPSWEELRRRAADPTRDDSW
jgi:hypothetical protein